MYERLFDQVLTHVPPHRAHAAALAALDAVTGRPRLRGWVRRWASHADGELTSVQAFGLRFPSPLGVAAGLDKDAEHYEGLGALGFGFVEVGTLTPRPQGSNPGRVLARLPDDRALLNRMGFPNKGAEAAARRLARGQRQVVVGVNVGKNRETLLEDAADDYAQAARVLAPHAAYVALNVSSPNTPGLRELEAVARLAPLARAVKDAVGVTPLLVKISPDLGDADVDAVADLAVDLGLAGIIATNTTVRRDGLRTPAADLARHAWPDGGGVSGEPLRTRSLELLQRLHARTRGRVVLVSAGGISRADDVWERVLAGATLVQSYTGFVYGGPAWPRAVNLELARRTRVAGVGSIQELVGTGGSVPAGDQ